MLIKISNWIQKQWNSLKANSLQNLMRKFLSCRNSSSSINDLTVGNNEAIATILMHTRVIVQRARSYDIGMNTLAHKFALVTTSILADTCTGDIYKQNEENITNKSIYGSNKKAIICSISNDSIYWSTNDPSKYNVQSSISKLIQKLMMFTWCLVDKKISTKCHKTMKTCNYCPHKVLYR